VTNARASGDYHPGNEQWQPLGNTAIFAWALAIAPTKDNFWSSDVQTGSSYSDHATVREPYNRLQAAVSTLSKGPVAPSDKIGRSDAALIRRSCAKDGMLLQGDKPAMAINAQHVQAAFGCAPNAACGPQGEVWATYTAMGSSDLPPFAVVLAAQLKAPFTLGLDHLDLGPSSETVDWVAFETNSSASLVPIKSGSSSAITLRACGKWDFELWALAPWDRAASGFVLLGEQDKWVPVSAARFSRLEFARTPSEQRAAVTAKGTLGETVHVAWAWGDDAETAPRRLTLACTVPVGGTVVVSIAYGAKPSVGKAFKGFCDGVETPVLA